MLSARDRYKPYLPFLILFCSLLVVHLFLPLNWSDDAVFAVKAAEMGLREFLSGSARPLTDALTYVFNRHPLLWRLLNPVVLTGLAVILSLLLSGIHQLRQNILICCTVWYPMLVLADAGFIATTVNYLWPITCGCLCLLPLRQLCRQERFCWGWLPLLLPLLAYAVNMQQMGVVLAAAFLLAGLWLAGQRRFPVYPILMLLLTAVGLLYSYSLNMFGGNNRMLRETARYFPTFSQLNVLEKVELGFSSTFYCLTMYVHLVWPAFLLFAFFLMQSVFRHHQGTASRLAAAFPFGFSLVFGLLSLLPERMTPFLSFVTGGLQNYGVGKASYAPAPMADFLFLLVCGCVLYSLWLLLGRERFWGAFFALALGLGSRLLMGFSPTVWASGFRTFAILLLAFLVTAVMALRSDQGEQFSSAGKEA